MPFHRFRFDLDKTPNRLSRTNSNHRGRISRACCPNQYTIDTQQISFDEFGVYNVSGVAVSGNYAYVADDYIGLQVIDVRDPANPVRVGSYNASGLAYGVAVSGNYVYLADNDAGLQVIDVRDPANPVRVGGYNTSGSVSGVVVSGNYAYVADYDWGLAVFAIGAVSKLSIGQDASAGVQLRVDGLPGLSYQIETSPDLLEWTSWTNFLGTAPVMFITDPVSSQTPRRFYRLLQQ